MAPKGMELAVAGLAVSVVVGLVAYRWIKYVVAGIQGRNDMPALLVHGKAPDHPRVSIIVTMLNEEKYIIPCLKTLVRQVYPDYEVIVVDDNSTDRSYELVRKFAEYHPEVRLVMARAKPDGWIGKTWACMEGRRASTSGLLMFTDADTEHGPEVLRDAVSHMKDRNADSLTLATKLLLPGRWIRMTLPVVTSFKLVYPEGMINFRIRDVNAPGRDNGFVMGSYFLTKSTTYDDVGGHESVRSEIIEDWYLGKRIKQMGHVLKIAGGERVSAMWSRDLSSLYHAFTRLMAPIAARSGKKAFWCWLQMAFLFMAPHIATSVSVATALLAPWAYPWYVHAAFISTSALSLAGHTASFLLQCGNFGVPRWYALFSIAGSVIATDAFAGGLKGITIWHGKKYIGDELSTSSDVED